AGRRIAGGDRAKRDEHVVAGRRAIDDLCRDGRCPVAASERFARAGGMIDTSKPIVQSASSARAQSGLKHSLHRYRFLLLALLVVCVLPLTLRSGSLATEVLVFALAALGCNLLLGHTGLLSFGQGIFFGLGSHFAGRILAKTGLPVSVALLASAVTGAAAAALVGWFSIRQRGTYFVMLTLAFGQLFYFLAYTTPNLTGGDDGLLSIPRP